MEEKKKEIKKWPIVVLVLFLVLLVGSTFAWFVINLNSEKVNIIKAGTLTMTLDDEASEGILLEKAVPMSYQQGMETTEYEFTLKNDGSTATDYTISLIDEATYEVTAEDGTVTNVTIADDKKLEDIKIRYILLKNGEEAVATNSMLLSEATDRVIDTGTIAGGDTITYSLRVWIDSKATNEVMGKIFNARIRVEATQAQPEEETPQLGFVPTYFAFGTPTTESTTDYTTLGKNVFVTLGTDNSLGVCINDGGLFCIKNNDYENSAAALKAHFGEENCSSDSSRTSCYTESFDCYAELDGSVYSFSASTHYECKVNADGTFKCIEN